MVPMKSLVSWPQGVRPYRARDRSTLEATINAVCAEGRWMETPRYEPTPAWEHALTEPDCPYHLLLIVADSDQIVGWCRAFPITSQNAAEIGIGLLDRYRNRGLGTYLLQKAIHWANQSRFSYLGLTTRPENAHAIHTFEKLGFIPTGRMKGGQLEMGYRLVNIDQHKEAVL